MTTCLSRQASHISFRHGNSLFRPCAKKGNRGPRRYLACNACFERSLKTAPVLVPSRGSNCNFCPWCKFLPTNIEPPVSRTFSAFPTCDYYMGGLNAHKPAMNATQVCTCVSRWEGRGSEFFWSGSNLGRGSVRRSTKRIGKRGGY